MPRIIFPERSEPVLAIAIPSSILSTEPTLELKTLKTGIVGRAAAIYRVHEVIVYIDRADSWQDSLLIRDLLHYMVVAPYLRKLVFRRNKASLRYVGLLPPLQLPTHGVGGPREGEVRQALVKRRIGGRLLVSAGLARDIVVEGERAHGLENNTIVHIVLQRRGRAGFGGKILKETRVYTGYDVLVRNSLSDVVRLARSRNCGIVATSRKGEVVVDVYDRLKELVQQCVFVLFGAPDRGLYDIAAQEGFDLENAVDLVVNTVPGQGTLTVRTEEAIHATLSIINVLRSLR